MKTIRISRKKWLAGDKESKNACLWDPEVAQGCCLGHVIHQTARVSWNALADKDMPSDFYTGKKANCLIDEVTRREGDVDNSVFAFKAARINDDSDLSRKEKERQLIRLFKKNGFKLVFTE